MSRISLMVLLINLYYNIGLSNIKKLYSDGDIIYATYKKWVSLGETPDSSKKDSIAVGIPVTGYYYTRKTDGSKVKVNDMTMEELKLALEMGIVYRNKVELSQEPIEVYSYRSTNIIDASNIDLDRYRIRYKDIEEWVSNKKEYNTVKDVISSILDKIPLKNNSIKSSILEILENDLKGIGDIDTEAISNEDDMLENIYLVYEALRRIINKENLIDDKEELREGRAISLLCDLSANEVRETLKGGIRHV